MKQTLKENATILVINASARKAGSTTRQLGQSLIAQLTDARPDIRVVERDVSDGLPFVNEAWVGANFTPEEDRTDEQRQILALSDTLIEELEAADLVVIGSPVYNFGIPAVLKAWIDLVARARKTFRYTENGPVGLLEGKQAIILAASGGTEIGGQQDFATSYLRFALGFIGIHDVSLVSADRGMARGEEAVRSAEAQLTELLASDAATAA